MTSERHILVRGGSRAQREQLIAAMDLPPQLIAPVDAHARLRGPYTAGGEVVGAITRAALRSDPALARRHDIEIRALAPQLRHVVPIVREVLAEAVPRAERTRVYPRLRSRRLANGVTDFLHDYLLGAGAGPRSLVIENLHHADPSDRQLAAIFLRRLSPSLLTIVACDGEPAEGAGRGDPLAEALTAHAAMVLVVPTVPGRQMIHGARERQARLHEEQKPHWAHGTRPPYIRAGERGRPGGRGRGYEPTEGTRAERQNGLKKDPAKYARTRRSSESCDSGESGLPGQNEAAMVGGADRERKRNTRYEKGAAGSPVDRADVADRGDRAASLAAIFVNRDGTSDDPALLAAYQGLSPAERARLHDARANELAGAGEPGPGRGSRLGAGPGAGGSEPAAAGGPGLAAENAAWLGAIPYHRERGTDPAGAGVRALADAAQHCFAAGLHDAVADLGARGRALAEAGRDPAQWWLFTSLAAASHAALGRGATAEALYDEARAESADPAIHRQAAYETAMLYARHHDPPRRDVAAALPWINQAIAFARTLTDPAERAFNLAFTINGRAFIELRLGNPRRALRLVDDAIALLDRNLPAGSHPLDRCSLLANRARLLTMEGSLDDALTTQDALITLDPTNGEYHFERGNLLHLLGRDDEALAAYAQAQELALPFPELHYNIADLLAAREEDDAALAELDRTLELAPEFLDARVNRAGILAARGDGSAAWPDVLAGLAQQPENPYLLCVRGQLDAAEGKIEAARAAYDAAIAAAPRLTAAWANRAALFAGMGDPDAAAADLTRALELTEGADPSLLFNRAIAHRAAGRLHEAVHDAEHAAKLRPDDAATLVLLAELSP